MTAHPPHAVTTTHLTAGKNLVANNIRWPIPATPPPPRRQPDIAHALHAEEVPQHAKQPDAGVGAAEPRQIPVVQPRLRVDNCVDHRRTRGSDGAPAD